MTAAPTLRKVAVVLFEGFTVLDVYGPVQAFASCRVRTVTVPGSTVLTFSMAERAGVVKPGEGPPSYAEYSLADDP